MTPLFACKLHIKENLCPINHNSIFSFSLTESKSLFFIKHQDLVWIPVSNIRSQQIRRVLSSNTSNTFDETCSVPIWKKHEARFIDHRWSVLYARTLMDAADWRVCTRRRGGATATAHGEMRVSEQLGFKPPLVRHGSRATARDPPPSSPR